MKRLILIGSAILMTFSFYAQTFGEIHGKVFDEYGDPIPFASAYVTTMNGKQGAQSDFDGKFKIKPLAVGIYNVEISCIGKGKVTLAGVTVNPDAITFLEDVVLEDQAILVGGDDQGPKIYAYRPGLIDKQETGKMTVRAADIKHSPVKRDLAGFVSSMSSDISKSADGQQLYFRGSRAEAVQYIVDGVKVVGGFGGIPASGIGAISVYTGGIPAKYGDVTGGVIIIESKNYFDLYNEWYYSQKN